MVLAAGRDCQLFGRPLLRRARRHSPGTARFREMGMVVISSSIAVGPISQTLTADGKPTGEGGKALAHAFPRFADDLAWWMEAARRSGRRRSRPIERDAGSEEPRLQRNNGGSAPIFRHALDSRLRLHLPSSVFFPGARSAP